MKMATAWVLVLCSIGYLPSVNAHDLDHFVGTWKTKKFVEGRHDLKNDSITVHSGLAEESLEIRIGNNSFDLGGTAGTISGVGIVKTQTEGVFLLQDTPEHYIGRIYDRCFSISFHGPRGEEYQFYKATGCLISDNSIHYSLTRLYFNRDNPGGGESIQRFTTKSGVFYKAN